MYTVLEMGSDSSLMWMIIQRLESPYVAPEDTKLGRPSNTIVAGKTLSRITRTNLTSMR